MRTPMTASAQDQALVESWRALADRHARITCALERVPAPDKDQHRMQELAEAVYLSQSALSRLIGRLEGEGLVTRAICSEERRGLYACLTAEGRARYEA